MLTFKKLESDVYYVTDGKNASNMYARKSVGQWSIDIAQYYFEESTLAKAKQKVERLWLEGKLETFEI
jgi:hypothetical protein